MFAFLRGTVAAKGLQSIALDVGGVGYEVFVPDFVHERLSMNREVTLLTYCHIREESFHIFGFLRQDEKALFELLLGITGVGPKVALSVLSTLPPSPFAAAIQANDVTAFTRAPGVGKKMAQRIVLEAKTKLGQSPELSAILGEPGAESVSLGGDDAYEALISLGCTPQEAKKAVVQARSELGPEAKDENVVRVALRSLARK
jgi:Holliday junction DNA helicase RuvA